MSAFNFNWMRLPARVGTGLGGNWPTISDATRDGEALVWVDVVGGRQRNVLGEEFMEEPLAAGV